MLKDRTRRLLSSPSALAESFGAIVFFKEIYSFVVYSLDLHFLPGFLYSSSNHLNLCVLLLSFWLIALGLLLERNQRKFLHGVAALFVVLSATYFAFWLNHGKQGFYFGYLAFDLFSGESPKTLFGIGAVVSFWILINPFLPPAFLEFRERKLNGIAASYATLRGSFTLPACALLAVSVSTALSYHDFAIHGASRFRGFIFFAISFVFTYIALTGSVLIHKRLIQRRLVCGAERKLESRSGTVLIPGICVILLLAGGIFGVNGSSINVLARMVQGPEAPQIGIARNERSDEYLLSTPEIMYQALKKNRFDAETSLLGPHKTALLFNVPVNHPTTVLRPQLWPFFIFGPDRAYGLYWQYKNCILLAGVFSLLLFITHDSMLSALGSLFFFFSGYTQWFFSSPQSPPELVGTTCFIALAFCVLCVSKRWLHALALGVLLAILLMNFTLYLYPSFQIPLALLALALGAGWVVGNWEEVWDWKYLGMRVSGLAVSVMVAGALLAYIYVEVRDVIGLLSNTNYPALVKSPIESGGSLTIWWHVSHFFDPFKSEQLFPKSQGNICESSGYLWLAPLMLCAATSWKSLKKPQLSMLVACYAVFFIILSWQVLPIPHTIGSFFLLNYVAPNRAWPGLGLANVLAMCIALSSSLRKRCGVPGKDNGPHREYGSGRIFPLPMFAAVFALLLFSNAKYETFWSMWQLLAASFILVSFLVLASHRMPKTALLVVVAPLAINNAFVNPITIGMRPFTESPVRRFVESNDSLRTGKVVVFQESCSAQFLGGCGVNVLNTFKFVPDLETWSKLDSGGKYADVYNRCAWSTVLIDRTVTGPVFELDPKLAYSFKVKVNPDAFPYRKWGIDSAVFAYGARKDNPEQLELVSGGEVWPFWFYTVESKAISQAR